MLLPRRQGQYEAATTFGVHRLAAVAAGRLAKQLLARGEQADIGAAEVQGVADRLALGGDDVGAHLAGRFQQAHRHRLRDHDDQQGAGGVGGLGDPGDIRGRAEDVGRLDDDAGGVGTDLVNHGGLGVHGGGQSQGLHADGVNHSSVHTDFMIGSTELDVAGVDRQGDETPILRRGEWVLV